MTPTEKLGPFIRKSLRNSDLNNALSIQSLDLDDNPTAAEKFKELADIDTQIAEDLSEPAPIIPQALEDKI